VLNLYYEEKNDDKILSEMYLWECADIPVPTKDEISNEEQPYRGFAFNQSWDFNGMQIILINGKPRLQSLRVQQSAPEDAIWASILPRELQPEDAPPFDVIDFYGWSPTISVSWNSNASKTDIDKYHALAKNLTEQKEMHDWGFEIKPAALNINTDGLLSLIDCGVSK
jgi:hypothetical protein